jgi:hypothetical protein
MEIAQRRCCGIDVHKKKLMVHVLPPQGDMETNPLEREFRTFTRDLREYWRAVSFHRGRFGNCGISPATEFI